MAGEMPIYDDPLASVKSIERLKAIEGIEVLLAAWDQPREGDQAYKIMDETCAIFSAYTRRLSRSLESNLYWIRWNCAKGS